VRTENLFAVKLSTSDREGKESEEERIRGVDINQMLIRLREIHTWSSCARDTRYHIADSSQTFFMLTPVTSSERKEIHPVQDVQVVAFCVERAIGFCDSALPA
jgi:hypothetical protein